MQDWAARYQGLGWAVLLFTLAACGSRSPLKGGAREHSVEPQPQVPTPKPKQRELDKLDILLAVDDSISMADKQRLLRDAVPDLIGRLANPLCVDADRVAFAGFTPGAGQPCPKGPNGQLLEREFLPVSDVHVGLVTSSVGAAGGDSKDYQAHLLGSLAHGAGLPGMTPQGFLAWTDAKPQADFQAEVQAMMEAVGESGAGYEGPHEAWLRFLVDPAPFQELLFGPCDGDSPAPACSFKYEVDQTVLQQRQAFLRPDSVLVIVVLSDEDDCSAAVTEDSWRVYDVFGDVPRGTSVCLEHPEDACCVPCDEQPAPGCAADPTCDLDPFVPARLDNNNLRCFDQKRRFGRDALYPMERYKNALSQLQICPERLDLSDAPGCGELVDNPLFINLKNGRAAQRTPQGVFLTFIVGVPWQDIAVDPLNLTDPGVEGLTYMSPEALDAAGAWDLLIGDSIEPPGDPLMLQSVATRSGVHPITGEVIAGPEAWPVVNSINGHDRTIPDIDDLQYACTFALPALRQCADLGDAACDCTDPKRGYSPDNPMCQDPKTGEYSTLQRSGKAYPGRRHATLARMLGDAAVLSSICPRNTRDTSRSDYAYRPTVTALIERIAPVLKQPE